MGVSELLDQWRSYLRGLYMDAPPEVQEAIQEQAGKVMAATFPSMSRDSELGKKVFGNLVMRATAEHFGVEEKFRRVVFMED